jgi:hypothetical protein
MPPLNTTQVEDRIGDIAQDAGKLATRQALENVPVDVTSGMIEYRTAAEVAYMGELYAKGAVMLPAHLRNSPGACALTLTQAIKWRLDFMFVASMQYVQGDGDKARVNYMSQIFRAIMENSDRLKNRMRHEYIGEGDERRCKVWATFKGEDQPHEYISPTLKQLMPETYTKDGRTVVKGSPLWLRKPDIQMLYDTQRDWVRMHAPDLFGGVYDPDEFAENAHVLSPRNVIPDAGAQGSDVAQLATRLRDNKRKTVKNSRRAQGFNGDHVETTIGDVASAAKVTTIDGETTEQEAKRVLLEGAATMGRLDAENKTSRTADDFPATWGDEERAAYQSAFTDAWKE